MAARKVRAGRRARKIRQYERAVLSEEGEGTESKEQERTKNEEKMSKRAYKFIDDDAVMMNNGDRMVDASTAYMAVDYVEIEMAEKATHLFEQFMSGVFQGDTPKKMAEEFKQKLME